MRLRLRRAMRPLAICLMGLLMTGCIKLNMALELQPNDTVNGSVIFAVNKQLLSLTGSTFDQITQGQAVLPSDVPVQRSDYSDDTYVGKKYTFENVPISRFSSSSSGDSLTIEHQNDTYVVNGALDLSSSATGDTSQLPNASQVLSSADISLSVTFPGPVQSTNGTVDGNMVTWKPKFGDSTEITATGSAVASGGGALMWILIAAAVVIVAVVAVVLLARRKPKAPAGEGAEAGEAGEAGEDMAAVAAPVSASEPSVPPPPPSGTTESTSGTTESASASVADSTPEPEPEAGEQEQPPS
jgi:hypothetical protein